MGTEEQWVQSNTGQRGTLEKWAHRNGWHKGTLGTEEHWSKRNTRHRGTVGREEETLGTEQR